MISGISTFCAREESRARGLERMEANMREVLNWVRMGASVTIKYFVTCSNDLLTQARRNSGCTF